MTIIRDLHPLNVMAVNKPFPAGEWHQVGEHKMCMCEEGMVTMIFNKILTTEEQDTVFEYLEAQYA
ncbi:MAG TPA: hypothetical protein ENI05_07290 [Porticoccus sp.]|nr:hypothetical protein [Porticoccus sp.]